MIKNERTSESDRNDVILSYTLTETKKKALINISRSIKVKLNRLRVQTNKIRNKQHELKTLTGSKKNQKWKMYLKSDMLHSIEQFNKEYSELEELCADLGKLLEPKKRINEEFSKLLSFANKIDDDEYTMCPDSFNYTGFLDMIAKFSDSIDKALDVMEIN